MGRTLLVGHSGSTWRERLKDSTRDWVCLDPRDADHGPPGRVFWLSGGKVKSWRLIGSVDVSRNPVGYVSAAFDLLGKAPGDSVVSLFPVRQTPLYKQLALEIAQIVSPEEIIVPTGSGLFELGWPVGAAEQDSDPGFPQLVLEAQRRARWLEMFENSVEHEVDLRNVSVLGSRLGSGQTVSIKGWLGWAELTGNVLHLVGDQDPTENEVSAMLDLVHANRLSLVSPKAYQGLLCSFSSQTGEDFGIGTIEEFLPERGLLRILCTAVAPAPVRILRLGTLKLDKSGREVIDVKPWSL